MTRELTAREEHALNLIYSAAWTPEQTFEATQKGWRGKPYDYTKSKLFQGLVELRKVGPPSPGPGPTPVPTPGANPYTKLAQNVIYCAQNPLSALGAPSRYIPALTADPGYASFNTPSVVAQLRSKFPVIAGWGVQTQIGAQAIRDFVGRLGLNYCIFQGETSEEYRTAIEAGARVIVGNANSWLSDQRADATARINRGELAFAQETYTNLGGPWPKDSSAGGVPAASFVLGCYDGTNEQPGRGWNPSLAAYKANTPPGAWPTVSIYHAAGVAPAEWGLLV